MTDVELLADHVARFNEGVRRRRLRSRCSSCSPMTRCSSSKGCRSAPFMGIDAIRVAYREQPPDDEIAIEEPRQDGEHDRRSVPLAARRRSPGRRAAVDDCASHASRASWSRSTRTHTECERSQ